MRLMKGYRFRLEPTTALARELARIAGCCRFVFNRALALQKERFEASGEHLGYAAVCRELTTWRQGRDAAFLARAPTHPLQQALKDLDRAYRNFFEHRAEPPRFRKKGRHDRFRFPDSKQFAFDEDHARVKLPKLGWIRYRSSRPLEGTPKQITISREHSHWFISVQTEQEVTSPIHASKSMVGVDVGVTKFATLSTGETFAPVGSFRVHERKLGREQRKLARRVKFSRNWKRQKERIAKLHTRIAHIRNDFLHKTSTSISKTHAVIVLEDLAVMSMSRSKRGTLDAPGRDVRAKAGLNKRILDQGWREFRRQLEYKQLWRGGMVIAVDPHDTSRKCSRCGHVAAANRASQASFRCVRCGYSADADANAADNILAAGHAVIACGETALVGAARRSRNPPCRRPQPGRLAGFSDLRLRGDVKR